MFQAQRTKDHVIGRRFVPKGKLAGQWNLILKSCSRCNEEKSYLEDDMSAISLYAYILNDQTCTDQQVFTEAQKKAWRAKSRRTNKNVIHSEEELPVQVSFGYDSLIEANFVAPPQPDELRLYRLAELQVRAFFFYITYDRDTARGGFWLGGFHPLSYAGRSDWGNPLHQSFMNAVTGWSARVVAVGADGFFKVAIRRHPSAECWSWAVEWNHSIRAIGFFGDRHVAQDLADSFEEPVSYGLFQESNMYVRLREEIPLVGEDDRLFQW